MAINPNHPLPPRHPRRSRRLRRLSRRSPRWVEQRASSRRSAQSTCAATGDVIPEERDLRGGVVGPTLLKSRLGPADVVRHAVLEFTLEGEERVLFKVVSTRARRRTAKCAYKQVRDTSVSVANGVYVSLGPSGEHLEVEHSFVELAEGLGENGLVQARSRFHGGEDVDARQPSATLPFYAREPGTVRMQVGGR